MGWLSRGRARRDRTAAAAELADRFEIVGDDFRGTRRPNQVTQAEFDRVATLYSDVRMGHSNIDIDATNSGMRRGDFKDAVMGDLGTILTTEQGRGLLHDLAYEDVDGRTRTTTIGASETPAGAVAGTARDGNLADAVNGVGTNAAVIYRPGVDFDIGANAPTVAAGDTWRNFTSDTVLFHELIHANNIRTGTLNGTVDPTTGELSRPGIHDREAAHANDHGVAQEEYETVGIGGYTNTFTENAYRAERAEVMGTRVPRRRSYNGTAE